MEKLVSDDRLAQIQAVSGLSFTTFLGLHLANTLFAHSGPHGYDGVMSVLREFYQNRFVEPLLLSSLLVHQASSVLVIVRRIRRVASTPLAVKLHRYSAYVLGSVVVGHIFATRGSEILFGEPADFGLITFSLKNWPAFFYPYYAIFGCSGIYHLTYGTSKALHRLFGVSIIRRRILYALVAAVSVGLVSALAGFGGLYFPVHIEKEAYLRRIYELQFPAFLLPWKRSV